MAVIRTLLIILEAACSLALIGLILLQKSKDGGLGLAFGAGGNDSLFGARRQRSHQSHGRHWYRVSCEYTGSRSAFCR